MASILDALCFRRPRMGDAFEHGRLRHLGNRRGDDTREVDLGPDEPPITEIRTGRREREQDSPQALTHRPRALSHNIDGGPFDGKPYIDLSVLSPLMDQLLAIVEKLREASLDSSVPRSGTSTLDAITRRQRFVEMARVTYAKRRKRNAIFGDLELFGEPAWDILLDLYIAHAEDKPVSVSSACIGSASPPTTGLRWLGILTEQGLVERRHDPRDQRRVLVQLTERALEAMNDYFASAANFTVDRRATRN